MATLRFTILGCGSSGGVPRIGGNWGDCDPTNPRNRRRRCSLLVERVQGEAKTCVLIDTSPDMRDQLLSANVTALDAVVYSHSHADHTHGIDDLRQIAMTMRARLPTWADDETQAALLARFGYAYEQEAGSFYPPILDMRAITGDFAVEGPGGSILFQPFTVDHGSMNALGFRVGPFAYLPDVLTIPDAAWPSLTGLECLVIDALRRKPHPTHAHLDLTLGWIARLAPTEAILTNMHLDMDYATLVHELPPTVSPAYDGRVITFENQP